MNTENIKQKLDAKTYLLALFIALVLSPFLIFIGFILLIMSSSSCGGFAAIGCGVGGFWLALLLSPLLGFILSMPLYFLFLKKSIFVIIVKVLLSLLALF